MWIAVEAPGVVPLTGPEPDRPDGAGSAFLVGRDGAPAAGADPHGARLRRIPSGAAGERERR